MANFAEDLGQMRALVEEGDLFTPFAHGSGQTLLRETMLVADHNAYHLGQLVTIRRLLGAWPGRPRDGGSYPGHGVAGAD